MSLPLLGVDSVAGVHPLLLVIAAAALDWLVGDPHWCLHPVVVMGCCISRLRELAERWAGDNPLALRLAGALITLLLVGGSGAVGWSLVTLTERLPTGTLTWWLAQLLLLIALASALAGRSLTQAVEAVLATLARGDLAAARQKLGWIVGRDTEDLAAPEILRALAETASENAVDGLFAPLFWMLVGASVGQPLALVWGFKAASTLDSMLGYRTGRLRWLGTAGARLDDLLVWLPCRLLALSLGQLAAALRDGAADPSPNAGVSQAAYAHAAGVQLGGLNRYGGVVRGKPLLNAGASAPDATAVRRMLALSRWVALLWLGIAAGLVAFITKALS